MRNLILLTAFAVPSPATAQARRAITFDDFAAVRAVSDPQLSPDGHSVLYAVRTTDVGANRRTTRTYVIPAAGGAPRVWPDGDTPAGEARWSPDGRNIAYISGGQLWIANTDGGARTQLTKLTGGASGPRWSPAGDRIAFVSSVYAGCRSEQCNADSATSRDTTKVKAHVAERLLYRHWTIWDEGTRSHLFVVRSNGEGLRDVTEGARYDVPPPPFGGSEAYAWSADGNELAFTAKDPTQDEAWSTDINVYTVGVNGGPPAVITAANKGADQNPVYSPDGRFIAYASQARPGFESDKWRLMFHDRATGRARELLPRWDRYAETYAFSADSRTIFIGTGDHGRDKYFRVPIEANGMAATQRPEVIIATNNNTSLDVGRDRRTFVWVRDAAHYPPEVMIAVTGEDGRLTERRLTHENDALLAQLDLRPAEDFWFRGAAGDSVQGFVLRPPGFADGRKYPTLFLIHGGPQGAWLDSWSGRWNYQMFAAPGYGLVFINPRGSTGYGQRFIDEITKDWAGKVYTDLMTGLNTALRRNPWLDSTRMGAAGGSYGGYMVNWIAGHSRRFKALASHAGVFNLEAMYGATEELWFTDWEFGGPWWNPVAMRTQYRKNSPHLFAARFRTPMLVIHGELDYRVPYTEGLSLFTAYQRQNLPSRLVVFPDEGHWINKPQNQRLWWKEMQGWMKRWLGTDFSVISHEGFRFLPAQPSPAPRDPPPLVAQRSSQTAVGRSTSPPARRDGR